MHMIVLCNSCAHVTLDHMCRISSQLKRRMWTSGVSPWVSFCRKKTPSALIALYVKGVGLAGVVSAVG